MVQPSERVTRAGPGDVGAVRFIGRTDELAAVSARAQAGAATILSGPAGIGKTRLAGELADRFRADGWTVVVRHATVALRDLPLGLFSDLLDPAGDPLGGPSLAGAYRAVCEHLPPGRSMLVIDDAPLIDAVSALLVQRLIENGATAVLLTARRGEPLPDGLAALRPSATLGTTELRVLEPGEALQLAVAAARGRVPAAQLERIAAVADGVPLFVLGLVQEQLSDRAPGTPSASLDMLVHSRFGRATRPERDALELIALGEPLELTIVDACCDADALERLERNGLIAVTLDRRRRVVQTAHPLYSEAIAGSLPLLRRRRLVRTLADEVERSGLRRDDDLLRVVLWRLDAGDPVPPDALVSAGRHALARGGLAVGERLLSIVIGEGGDAPGDPDLPIDLRVEAACLLANLRLEQGRPADTVAICAATPAGGSDQLQARLVSTSVIASFHYLGDVATARALIERSERTITPPWNLEVRFIQIASDFYAGSTTDAVALVEELLASSSLTERTWVWYMAPGVLALATNGRTAEAVHHAEVCTAKARRYADTVGIEAHAWTTWAYARTMHAGPRGCVEPIRERMGAAIESGDRVSAGFLRMIEGFLRLHEARLHDAIELFDLPAEMAGGWALWTLALRTQALALTGHTAAAQAALARTATLPQATFHHAVNRCAAGEVALALADGAAAEIAFLEAAEHAEAMGQHSYAAHAWLRALGASGDEAHATRLAEAARRLDGPLGEAFRDLAQGWRRQDPGDLERSVASLDRHDHHLYALHGRDLLVAVLSRDRAHAAAAGRVRAQAARGWERARRAPAGQAAPARSAVGPDDGGLTRREREVVQLAATGLTDQAIADELLISLRTVHAHLRSAYRKLGVGSRRDLRDHRANAGP